MELKKPLDFNEQVRRLEKHGMQVSNENFAIRILREINYYRFTGYALQFRINPHLSEYVSGTNFEQVYRLYLFDVQLRDLFRKYIEKVEVYYRTQIAHGFVMNKCLEEPHDQHYNEENFYYKKGYRQVFESFNRQMNYYKNSLIVKHHERKYGSKMPLWAMTELLSFSNISKLYGSMYISEKERVAAEIGISYETLENHLHCMAVLRNKCAHAARLYNTTFNPPARFNRSFLRKHPEIKNNSLFAYTLVLVKRLPDFESKERLVRELVSVIEEYREDIDTSLIGFPEKYAEILENSMNGGMNSENSGE